MVIVVALLCSWLAGGMKKARDQEAAVAAIEKTQGDVIYDDVTWGSAKVNRGSVGAKTRNHRGQIGYAGLSVTTSFQMSRLLTCHQPQRIRTWEVFSSVA